MEAGLRVPVVALVHQADQTRFVRLGLSVLCGRRGSRPQTRSVPPTFRARVSSPLVAALTRAELGGGGVLLPVAGACSESSCAGGLMFSFDLF
jgi:hypothetical protein